VFIAVLRGHGSFCLVDNTFVKEVYVALLAIARLVCHMVNGWANMNSLDFGRVPFLYYFIAFCGILFVCVLSSYLCSLTVDQSKGTVCFLGKKQFDYLCFAIALYPFVSFCQQQYFDLNMVLYGKNPVYIR
jgi:hypothetical protein